MSAPTAMPTPAISTAAPTPAPSCACVAHGSCAGALSATDEAKIRTLQPEFGTQVRLLLRLMATAGHPMFVTSARRTSSEQQALYAQGRTKPGAIVTHLDGVARRSKHQDGVAVDCAFQTADIWDGPWEMYGKFAEAIGLNWGGAWKRFPDRPHCEMRT